MRDDDQIFTNEQIGASPKISEKTKWRTLIPIITMTIVIAVVSLAVFLIKSKN